MPMWWVDVEDPPVCRGRPLRVERHGAGRCRLDGDGAVDAQGGVGAAAHVAGERVHAGREHDVVDRRVGDRRRELAHRAHGLQTAATSGRESWHWQGRRRVRVGIGGHDCGQ